MRKFIILLAVVMLMLGVKLHYNWLSYIDMDASLTIFHKGGAVTTFDKDYPTLLNSNETVRLDIDGGQAEADQILKSLAATTLWVEVFDTVKVVYAYSGRIANYTEVLGKKVNLMLAIAENTLAIGSPLLKGSY